MALVAVVLTAWIAAALGRRLLTLSGVGRPVFSLELGLAGGLGLSVLSLAVTLLGLCQGYYPWAGWALLGLAGLIAGPANLAWPVRAVKRAGTWLAEECDPTMRWLVVWLAAVTGLLVFIAHAPVTFSDALHYHLELPRQYLAHHGLYPVENVDMAGLPQGGEMLSLLGLLLSNDLYSQLIPLVCGSFLLLLVHGTAVAAGLTERTGLLAGAFFYAQPVVVQYYPLPMPDTAAALAAGTCLAAWLQFRKSDEIGWLVLAGLAGGAAAHMKFNGGAMPFVLFAVMLIESIRRPGHRGAPWIFAGLVLLFGTHWFVYNTLWRGHPLYPFEVGPLQSPLVSDLLRDYLAHSYQDYQRIMPYFSWRLIGQPFVRTFNTGIYGSLSPILVVFLPLLLFFKKPGAIRLLALVVGLGYLALYPLTNEERWLLPIFPWACLLAAWAAEKAAAFGLGPAKAVKWVVIVALLFNLAYTTAFAGYVGRGALGLDSRDDYLAKRTQYYRAYQWIHKNTPPDAKIAIPRLRGYYLNRDYDAWREIFYDPVGYDKLTTPDQLVDRLKEMGFDYILVARTFVRPPNGDLSKMNLDQRRLFLVSRAEEGGRLKLVYQNDQEKVYRIN